MTDKKLKILISNDDSIYSRGIKCLVEIAKQFGEVTVVAPNRPQSAKGHSITLTEPLRLKKKDLFGPDVVAYACSGTPVDCIKIAMDKILDEKPDLCLSGINHGSNASINVVYSGTMGAAMEAAIDGVPSIGFSDVNYDEEGDLSVCKKYAPVIIEQFLKFDNTKSRLINVNFPSIDVGEIKGIKICRQSIAMWKEDFQEKEDPYGGKYYWLLGQFKSDDIGEGTDVHAIKNGFISVVPVKFDLTSHEDIDYLNKEWNINEKVG